MDLQEFLSRPQQYKTSKSTANLHAVFDIESNRLVSVSQNLSTIKKISDSFLNTDIFLHISHLLPAEFNVLCPYYYEVINPYDSSNVKISKSRVELSGQDLLHYATIAEKGFAMDYIFNTIANHRRRNYFSLVLQYEVYNMKYEEAQKILDNGICSDDKMAALEYPFVYDYAQLENLTLIEAAKEIVFQRQLFYTKMSTIESLRMKYSKAIIEATDLKSIPGIIVEFNNLGREYVIS
jgi:hypothetical protein